MSTEASVQQRPARLPYDDSPTVEPRAAARQESLIKRFMWTSTLFLVIAGLLGLVLRQSQANIHRIDDNLWYALMTAHGLGAFVAWAGFFLMGSLYWILLRLGYPLRTYIFAEISYWTMVIGTLGIVWTTLVSGFGASWVALYPLPFKSAGKWSDTTTGIFSFAVLLAGVSIIVWCVSLIVAVTGPAAESASNNFFYKVALGLGFDHMWPNTFKRTGGRKTPYPLIPLTVVAINMAIMTLPFAVLLVLMILQSINSGITTDPLLAKNLLWAFGHPVVYLLLFPVVSCLYYFIPRYAGRNMAAGRIIVLAWIVALTTNMFLWAHHMYLDSPDGSIQNTLNLIHEPITFAIVLASSLSLYALSVTIFRSNFLWNAGSKFMIAGMVGWLTAGFQGVLNADIQFDNVLHNTLWIVGHFHHMALLGMGMVIMGVMYAVLPHLYHKPVYSEALADVHLWGMLVGGYGWMICWLIPGLEGAPRRWAILPHSYDFWTQLSIPFLIVMVLGILVGLYNYWKTVTGSPWAAATGGKEPAAV
ncbi:MAG: cbb3-type cytochrome c oxidase subunit I [Thermoleophilia bacterium]